MRLLRRDVMHGFVFNPVRKRGIYGVVFVSNQEIVRRGRVTHGGCFRPGRGLKYVGGLGWGRVGKFGRRSEVLIDHNCGRDLSRGVVDDRDIRLLLLLGVSGLIIKAAVTTADDDRITAAVVGTDAAAITPADAADTKPIVMRRDWAPKACRRQRRTSGTWECNIAVAAWIGKNDTTGGTAIAMAALRREQSYS